MEKKKLDDKERRRVEHFFRNVLICLNIHGWRLRWIRNSSDGCCWRRLKVIDIGEKWMYKKEMVIHEVAHIRTCRFCRGNHTQDFWWEFDRLMRKFLPFDHLSEFTLSYRRIMSKENYSVRWLQKE